MKAAVFHGPHDVRIENVADPAGPEPHELVLEVTRAAICGTDSSEWDHGPVLCRPGVVLGHEFVGRVVAARRRRQRPSAWATGSSRDRESRAVTARGACAGRRICAPSTARSAFRLMAGWPST